MAMRLTERSLYPPLIDYLSSLGASAVSEVETGGKYPDIVFELWSRKIVLQVKVGRERRLLTDGITQLSEHARTVGTSETLLFVYPDEVRARLTRISAEEISAIALDTQLIDALIDLEIWRAHYEKKKPSDLIADIVERFRARKGKVYDLSYAVARLREAIEDLASAFRKARGLRRLHNVVTGRMELFTALSDAKNDEARKLQAVAVSDLTAYILVNQLLFYQLFALRAPRKHQLSPLAPDESFHRIKQKLIRLRQIDFEPIYFLDVIGHIVRDSTVEDSLRRAVRTVCELHPTEMPHDLPGRLFHELLPLETRKLLATYYTRPVAAEILAGLTLETGKETVLDPACGSGTILVSAYRWKQNLLGRKRTPELHRRFLEEELSGVDIMPFATHLTAVNLAARMPHVTIRKINVGCRDSTELAPGDEVQMYTYQQSLLEAKPVARVAMKDGAEGSFQMGTYDAVIMNPPFTKQERLPADFKRNLAVRWKAAVGSAVNLWGVFTRLADELTHDGGRIGAVIPVNLLRGRESKKVRRFFTSDLHTWKWIVRATRDMAFSEKSSYVDILWVVEKRKPTSHDVCGVVLLKASLEQMGLVEAEQIARDLRGLEPGVPVDDPRFEVFWIAQSEIRKRSFNLMPFVAFTRREHFEVLREFWSECAAGGKVKPLETEMFGEGFRPVPKGLSKVVFVTRPLDKARTTQAAMILEKESDMLC